MTSLVLGPILRHVDRHTATVWVETDGPCRVSVLDAIGSTFEVAGHHYALVTVDLADRDEVTPYEVHLDGERVWPPPEDPWPAPVIRKPTPDGCRLVFGSCRAAAPDEEPWTLPRSDDSRGFGIDALEEYAVRLVGTPHADWPDLLLMLGDQVYADAASPETRAYARSRRDTSQPPFEDVADFEEYTRLYQESWSDPEIRWLLSTVPTAMIFDDHDIIDDWNISSTWLDQMHATDWWHDRIVGGLVSYWVYQHIGNLHPEELAANEVWRAVRGRDGDTADLLWAFAEAADRDPATTQWSYHRRIGDTDVVVVDTRAARVLRDGRDMLDPSEWDWLTARLADPARHVLVASSLPVLLPGAIHDVEGWNERLCAGAWGPLGRRAAEWLRQAIDLEHWAAFGDSFDRLTRLLHQLARNPDVGVIALLAGDVHYGSVVRADWADHARPIWQLTASPMRQDVEPAAARAFAFARSVPGRAIGRVLRRLSGGTAPALDWRVVDGPVLSNHVATVETRDGQASVRFEAAGLTAGLNTVIDRTLP